MRQTGFTLIEAIFSVLISALVITGIFNYFANSLKNVEKSEEDLVSIKQIQNLVTDLRYDLNGLKPFVRSSGLPIDGLAKLERFHTYRVKAFTTVSDEAKILEIDATRVRYNLSVDQSGKTHWSKSRKLDNFFKIPVKFSNEWSALENAAVNLTRTVDCSKDFDDQILKQKLQTPLEVNEFYMFSNDLKILYRYYPAPNSFVGRFRFTLNDELIDSKKYGLNPKTLEGLIRSFEVLPIFDHIYFQENINEGFELQFQKLFTKVAILVKGNSKRGPKSKPYVVDFSVTNPLMNSDKYHEGIFQ